MADNNKDYQISEQALNSLNDFKTKMEDVNDSIIDMGDELGDNLVKKLTQVVIEVKKIKNPLREIESISRKINDIIEETQVLHNQEAIFSRNYVKALQTGNREEQIKLSRKLDQIRAHIDINRQLTSELQTLKEVAEVEGYIYQQEKKKNNEKEKIFEELKKRFRLEEIKDMLSFAGLFKIALDAAFKFSEVSTKIGKSLGYGAEQSNRVANNLTQIANTSSNLNVTFKNLEQAISTLNEYTGGVAEYSKDALTTQILLTEQFKLSGEEAAGIYKFSTLAGKSSSKITDEMVEAFASTRNLVKGSADFKKTIAEAAKTSGQLAVNFKNNPAEITKAIVQAQILGTTLSQVKDQGRQLLDFESSLQNELEAELLTGQQINLERARAAALMGDQTTVMKELTSQGMTLEKFQNMNVLAQESFSKALGLSADQLSDQLRKQKIAQEQGKSLAQITADEAKDAKNRQDTQDKFNAAVDKLKDIIGNLIAGPFGQLLEMGVTLLNVVGLIAKPFALIGNIIDKITGSAKGLASVLKGILGIAAAIWVFINPIQALASLALAGTVIAGVQALIPGENKFAKGGIVTQEINNATIGEAGPEAIIPLNSSKADEILGSKKESIKTNTEIYKNNIDFTSVVSAIKEVRTAIDKLYNKDTTVNIDGKQVGTTLAQGSYRVA